MFFDSFSELADKFFLRVLHNATHSLQVAINAIKYFHRMQ